MRITGHVATSTPVYFGPGETYPTENSSAGPQDTVIIKWAEGDWYYINYPASNTRKCMYIKKTAVTNPSGTPPTFTASTSSKTSATSTIYWGPSGGYPAAGSVGIESVDLLGGKVEGGFAFIEYSISRGKRKRAWIPVSKLNGYSPSYSYFTEMRNGCTLRIIRTSPGSVQVADFGGTTKLANVGLHGVNAGFFKPATKEILQMAGNNGIPVRQGLSDEQHDGTENLMGRGCLYLNGSTLFFSRDATLLPAAHVWAQGGVDLELGNRLTNTGYNSVKPLAECIMGQIGGSGTYTSTSYRTAICANISENYVYMIISTTACNVEKFRKAVSDYLGVIEDGTRNNNLVAMALDGGGSTTMYVNNSSKNFAGDTRMLYQCMILV